MVRRSAANKCARNALCCFLLLVLSWAISAAQNQPTGKSKEEEKTPAQNSETGKNEEAADPLGRSTPHGTVFGFLQAAQSSKYREATQYLQLSKNERAGKGDQLAHQLHDLMDSAFVGRVGVISDRPEGSNQSGVPQDHERIGVFRLRGNETNVDLVRVFNLGNGEVWLFSSQTLAAVPDLYGQIEENRLEASLPRFLVVEQFAGIPLWRWIALLLLIPLSILLAWLVVGLVRGGLRFWLRRKAHPIVQDFYGSITAPVRLILTVIFLGIGIALMGFSLLFRAYYWRFAGLILATGVAWMVFRLINRWAERARSMERDSSGYRSVAIVLLGQRIFKVAAVILFVLVGLSILGFDMTTAIAGLGIGSIAIAFAAQKTLENLIGGISILTDEVIRVGDICRLGDKVGTVEDISLRSTRIRTRECTELSVPNGQLANMNVENLSRIDMSLFKTTLALRRETTPEQLRTLVREITLLLSDHAKVNPGFARVWFVGFGESSVDLEIRCQILTGNLEQFFAIREELLLEIMDLVKNMGAEFAIPARAVYTDERQSVDRYTAEAKPSMVYPRRENSRNL